MNTSPLTIKCKFCSEVSKANGEDPIGTANATDGWLVMELPLPWTEERFHHDPLLKPIHDLFHAIFERGIRIMPMAIAADREYSVPDHAHVFYYRRPSQHFSQFEKQSFLVPSEQIVSLAQTLALEPENVHSFLAYQQPSDTMPVLGLGSQFMLNSAKRMRLSLMGSCGFGDVLTSADISLPQRWLISRPDRFGGTSNLRI